LFRQAICPEILSEIFQAVNLSFGRDPKQAMGVLAAIGKNFSKIRASFWCMDKAGISAAENVLCMAEQFDKKKVMYLRGYFPITSP